MRRRKAGGSLVRWLNRCIFSQPIIKDFCRLHASAKEVEESIAEELHSGMAWFPR